MNIAILGNGKMGKRISELAKEKGHTIVAVSSSENPAHTLDLITADVAIDFSTPKSAFKNIAHAINSGIPVVSGTTGWLSKLEEIEKLCTEKEGAFLYASNFSLGMNIFFQLNKQLATLMKNQDYESNIHEIHHTKKLDSPSGTAITLSEQTKEISNIRPIITADRIDDTPGTHIISYTSGVDEIEIKHTAKNRDGFAMGAIIAAEWIIGKKGIFSMNDVLQIQ
ncbi:MAG: 4-hydroxy-tetrahydrodipicolinate reductase [Flavobacteriales bacterium]|nr:4-hydroxy-tetrahydrodipicolinate reductase [Flavobacteriales bacterium]